jgi:integral membrane protein
VGSWIAWRLAKLAALVLFAVGLGAVLSRPDRPGRLRAVHGLLLPGLVGLWVAGWAMAKATSTSLGAPWIGLGMLASLATLQAAIAHAHATAPRRGTAVRAVAGALAAVAAMVVRSSSPLVLLGLVVAATVLAVPVARALAAPPGPLDDDDATRDAALRAFVALARLEGASAVLLILVATPLKYVAHVLLDGGTGLLGWTHGVLLIAYTVVLAHTARPLGWTARRALLAFAAALVPLGTFAFERTLRAEPDAPRRAA